ncbi:MAG: Anti-anti-sigma regulatory factor [Methanophagales archaeon]|nr:Anti-anti-sigma regulatory factor [Methanophagales archaeon]
MKSGSVLTAGSEHAEETKRTRMAERGERPASERIPILQIEDFLLTSIQVPLHDRLALQFQQDLLQTIERTRAKGLLIDITAIDVVDSFITRILVEIAKMASLMGVKTVIVGLRPEISITLVEFGVEFNGIKTALNLEKGLEMLRAWKKGDYGENYGENRD